MIDFSFFSLSGDTKPTITPADPHIVVMLSRPFELRCQGEKAMQWQREDRLRVRGEKKIDGMSTLHIPRAQPVHMGRYICLEESSGEQASIYVYVKGSAGLCLCLGGQMRLGSCVCLWDREKEMWVLEKVETDCRKKSVDVFLCSEISVWVCAEKRCL